MDIMAGMDIDTLIVLMTLASVVIGGAVVGFFGVIFLAAFVYVWTHSYPWLKMVGKFAARPANFFSFIILAVLLEVVFIAAVYVLLTQLTASPNLPTFFVLLLVFAMIPVLVIVFILVELGLVVWIVRLIKWLFARWRGWLEGVYFSARLGFMRLKIKSEALQETAFRGGPGGGVRGKPGSSVGGKPGTTVRRGPATGLKMGKKGMSFKDKLEALKSEFSSDVQRARSKLSRRK